MIAYTTIGTNDFEGAKTFYTELFAEIGIAPMMVMDTFAGFGTSMDKPMFAICKPQNGEAATGGNGTMIALQCESHDQVNALHGKALALGASDEGEPGPRGDQFYMAYFRDTDGNKIAAFTPLT